MESGQGQVGRGRNKTLGSFTRQGGFSLCRRTHGDYVPVGSQYSAPWGKSQVVFRKEVPMFEPHH